MERLKNIKYSYYSSLGNRQNNEDASIVVKTANGLLAVVADGLGGMAYGEFASRKAIETLLDDLCHLKVSAESLEAAISRANTAICDGHELYPESRTTIAAVWISEEEAIAMHVGDTRIYHFRGDKIMYQSMDHTVAQLAVRAGDISLEEIRSYDRRNVLIRALGSDTPPKITKKILDLQAGDRVLICSDGFWEAIWEKEMISEMVGADTAEEWLSIMRKHVEPKADDNNTAIAISI